MPAPPRRTLIRIGGTTGGSSSGAAGVFGYHIITPVSGVATIDLGVAGAGTGTFCFRLVLNATAVSIPAPIWTSGSISAGDKIWLYLYQDSTGGRALPSFAHTASGDFGNDVGTQQIDGTPSTMSVFQLNFHGTRWLLDVQSPPTGLATT